MNLRGMLGKPLEQMGREEFATKMSEQRRIYPPAKKAKSNKERRATDLVEKMTPEQRKLAAELIDGGKV